MAKFELTIEEQDKLFKEALKIISNAVDIDGVDEAFDSWIDAYRRASDIKKEALLVTFLSSSWSLKKAAQQ